jgi:hypothetical protein
MCSRAYAPGPDDEEEEHEASRGIVCYSVSFSYQTYIVPLLYYYYYYYYYY